jgi:hypothetical protein
MKTANLITAFLLLFAGEIYSQPNCLAPSTGFTPINDLGTGISTVTGLMGGLYPNGSNFLPSTHKKAGLQMASQVKCLDANGNPDAVNGKIVWLSIGMSNCTQETQQFIPQANAFAGKNPKLTLVDGAQGGQTASIISTPGNPNYANFWKTVDTRLTTAGSTAKQVQVIWFKEANVAGTTPIQIYHDSLVVQVKRIMNEIKTRFPNVKLCYLASRIAARYASSTLNPEPYSYWTGWAVKKVIEAQINGDSQLTYSGAGSKSPWLSWGIYMWSDGSSPQITNPNIFFTCPTDFNSDGTHPSTVGARKVGALLLNFFSTDSTSTPWFLGTGCNTTGIEKENLDNILHIYPNPTSDNLTIDLSALNDDHLRLHIFNTLGQCIFNQINVPTSQIILDISCFTAGLYFIQLSNKHGTNYYKKIIKE